VVRFTPTTAHNRALQRILVSRGVEGILLLPMRDALPLTEMLDWNLFSVVVATRGVPEPVFHRVLPNHFMNSVLICDQLERLGYRRIGLATNRGFDLLTSPGLAAGVVWQPVQGRAEQVQPLLWATEHPRGVAEWVQREKPDAIVVRGVPDAEAVVQELGLKFPGPIGIAVSNLEGSSIFAGIDGRVFEIGAAAVDQLNARIQSNEKGIPRVPTETTINGRWLPGKSVRSRHPLALEPAR
jgi:DNA-binding LacI/PurR family transcriptional regulator